MSGRQRGRRRTTTRRHTVAKVLVASLLVLAVVSGGGVFVLYEHLNGNLDTADNDPFLTNRPDPGTSGALNILVLGSDTREGAGNHVDDEPPGGSDTTILMHLAADRRSAYGVSIARDTVVDRPACTAPDGTPIPAAQHVLWNAAYDVGGAACTQQQFEQLTGLRADHYVVVDFTGFRSMVDAIGGVQICVPTDVDDTKYTKFHLDAGVQTLTGDDALTYVRLRHGIGDDSDTARIKRQQAFVASMARKVVSGRVLANPVKVVSFLDAATKSLHTDFENVAQIAGLARQFRGVGLKRIQFVSVPFVDSTDFPGRVEWTPEAADLWEKVRDDAPLGGLRDDAISAADGPGSVTPSTDPSDPGTPGPSEAPTPAGLGSEQREAAGLCG